MCGYVYVSGVYVCVCFFSVYVSVVEDGCAPFRSCYVLLCYGGGGVCVAACGVMCCGVVCVVCSCVVHCVGVWCCGVSCLCFRLLLCF